MRWIGSDVDTDRDGVVISDKMPSMCNKDVGPATFLMNDPGKFTGIIVPWGFGLTSEALDATECRVLPFGGVSHVRSLGQLVKSHLDGDCGHPLAKRDTKHDRGDLL
jgi:hypothetical protein